MSNTQVFVDGSNFYEGEQLEQAEDVKLKQRGRLQLIQFRPLKKGWLSGQFCDVLTTGGGEPTKF